MARLQFQSTHTNTMNENTKNILLNSFRANPSTGHGQLIAGERFTPLFGDQSLELLLNQLEDHYEQEAKKSSSSSLEDEVEALQNTNADLRKDCDDYEDRLNKIYDLARL